MALGLIAGLAGTAINALTGGAINKIMGGNNAEKQIEQQKKLMALQAQGAKEMADYSQQKQLETWEATNAPAQVEQYEKAGLNPALMYGGGGTGGQLGSGMGAMPTGGMASDETSRQQANAGTALMGAQMALLNAQTEKTKTETKKIGGVDTEQATAQTGLATSQTAINKIKEQLEGKSLYDQLSIISNTERIGRTQALVGENTATQQIEIKNQELTNLAIEAVAKQSGINLNAARINEITQGIQQKWQELNLKKTTNTWEHSDRLEAIKEYTKTALQTAGIQAAGNIIGDVVKIATRQPPQPKIKGSTTQWEKSDGSYGSTYRQDHY